MNAQQIDMMFEKITELTVQRDLARDHAVRLQDQLEAVKSAISSDRRKAASRANGLKGGFKKN